MATWREVMGCVELDPVPIKLQAIRFFLHVRGLELDHIKLQARPFRRSSSSTVGVLLVTHCCEARWHCWSKAARLGGSDETCCLAHDGTAG